MLSECSGGVGIVYKSPFFTSRNLKNKSANIVCENSIKSDNYVNSNHYENNHKLDILA